MATDERKPGGWSAFVERVRRFRPIPRAMGFFLLVRTSMPAALLVTLAMLMSRTVGENENWRMRQMVTKEVARFKDNYEKIQMQVEALRTNAMKTKRDLTDLYAQLTRCLDERTDEAKALWADVTNKLNGRLEELKRIKEEIKQELMGYIAIVKAAIAKMEVFVSDVLAFKDEMQRFVADLQAQLAPLNNIVKVLNKLSFGALDGILFKFPSLPAFPSLPDINLKQLVPDVPAIVDRVIKRFDAMKASAINDLSETRAKVEHLTRKVDVDIAFLDTDTLVSAYLDRITTMGSIAVSYLEGFRKLRGQVEMEMTVRRERILPVVEALAVILTIWAVASFILYLVRLKQNIKLAIWMLRGNDPGHVQIV